jgi:outer membrane protein with beta-barrel domain
MKHLFSIPKTFLLIFLFGLMPNLMVFSQNKNFKEAYVVKANNDTVFGFVNIKELKQKSTEVLFKKSIFDGVSKKLVPDSVKLFVLTKSQSFFYSMTFDSSLIFLQQLLAGPTSLYTGPNFLTDEQIPASYNQSYYGVPENNKDHLYFLQKQSGKVTLVPGKNFYPFLKNYFNDCEKLSAEMQTAIDRNYGQRDFKLIDYISQYNKCTNPEASNIVLKPEKKMKIFFGLTAGLHATTIHFTPELHSLQNINFEKTTGFALGAFLELTYNNKFFFNPEFLLTSNSGGLDYQYFFWSVGKIRDLRIELSTYCFQVPLFFKYSFGQKGFRPFIKAGPEISFILKHDYKNDYLYPSLWNQENAPRMAFHFLGMGYGFGIGLEKTIHKNIKTIYVELRFDNVYYNIIENQSEMIDGVIYTSDIPKDTYLVRNIGLNVGFKF